MRCLQAPAQVYESSDDQEFDVDASPPPPFELELLEAALMVATGAITSASYSCMPQLPLRHWALSLAATDQWASVCS